MVFRDIGHRRAGRGPAHFVLVPLVIGNSMIAPTPVRYVTEAELLTEANR